MTPAGVEVGHVQVLGHIPVRTDHRMVVAEIRVPGAFREAPLGAQPRPAQTRHQQIAPEQWQQFRTEHDQWAQHWEPDPILPVQQWMEATMEMLVRAVGPPAHQMGARVEAQEWGALMARKRRWLARARFQEQQGERLDQGPPDLGAARQRVRSRKGNVFAPVTTINDEQGSSQTGEAMMHKFARQMERKQGRPAKIFLDQGAGATDLNFPLGHGSRRWRAESQGHRASRGC